MAEDSDLTTVSDATLARRLIAGVYDLFLLFAVGFFYSMILTVTASALGYQFSGLALAEAGKTMTLTANDEYQPVLRGLLYQLGLYLSLCGFYLGFWRFRHATLGMQTWRMRLISAEGSQPSWGQLIIRALVGTVSLFVLGLGFIYSLADKQNRTLHDIASGTRVIVTPEIKNRNTGP